MGQFHMAEGLIQWIGFTCGLGAGLGLRPGPEPKPHCEYRTLHCGLCTHQDWVQSNPYAQPPQCMAKEHAQWSISTQRRVTPLTIWKYMNVLHKIRKTRSGGSAISYIAPKAWNDLSLHIRASSSILEFRKKLKTWLFK